MRSGTGWRRWGLSRVEGAFDVGHLRRDSAGVSPHNHAIFHFEHLHRCQPKPDRAKIAALRSVLTVVESSNRRPPEQAYELYREAIGK